MPSEDANWALLPGDPVGFFGLTEPYTRVDLKRAYNRMIRQYKPETCPDEFMRIRSAYEPLEHELRYGRKRAALSPLPSVESDLARESSKTPVDADRMPVEVEPETVINQIVQAAEESPEAAVNIVNALQADDDTVAVLRAFLADFDASDSFLDRLLAGFRQYPESPRLGNLVRAYLQNDLAIERAEEVLAALAQFAPAETFYYVTEALWIRCIAQISFCEVATWLAACEGHLRDHSAEARVVFDRGIVGRAVWQADESWIQERFADLEEISLSLAPSHEYAIDVLDRLHAYVQLRREFLNGNELRARIDEVLRTYFEDPALGEFQFLELQQVIVELGDEAVSAFDVEDEALARVVMDLFHVVANEIAAIETEEVPLDEEATNGFLNHLALENRDSLWGTLLGWTRIGYYLLLLGLLFAPSTILAIMVPDKFAVYAFIGILVLWAPVLFVVSILTDALRFKWVQYPLAVRAHRYVWRPFLLDYFRRTHASIGDLVLHLEGEAINNFRQKALLLVCLRDDPGLALFSFAQRYQS